MKVFYDKKELTPARMLATTSGYEVLSNEGDIKIILRKTTVFDNNANADIYALTYFIKTDEGWVKGLNQQSYRTREEFIRSIANVEEFSTAYNELRYEKSLNEY